MLTETNLASGGNFAQFEYRILRLEGSPRPQPSVERLNSELLRPNSWTCLLQSNFHTKIRTANWVPSAANAFALAERIAADCT